MKIQLLILSLGLIFSNCLVAQTLSPTVISSSGAFHSNTAGMLSETVGEMALVETFTSGNVILTQGFQQPEDLNVSIKDIDNGTSGIALGPNPTQGPVQIFFDKPEAVQLDITVCDLNGKIIHRAEADKSAQNNYVLLDLSSVAAGDYILDCKSSSGTSSPVSFSQKITVVR